MGPAHSKPEEKESSPWEREDPQRKKGLSTQNMAEQGQNINGAQTQEGEMLELLQRGCF